MKFMLINAPCTRNGVLGDTWYLPLGLVSMATALEEQRVEVDVEIVDGIALGMRETLRRVAGDVVGIAFNCYSVRQMEILAREANSNGAFTVAGGPAASTTAASLLGNNPNINAVVVGDGERAMVELVKAFGRNDDLSRVPNMVYRVDGRIMHNPREELPVSQFPMPRRDAGQLDPEEYIQAYAASCSDPIQESIRPTNVITRRGCPRRASGHGCSFCARIDKKVRARTPIQAWEEYRYLVEKFDVNYLYEDSDSWIDPRWLRRLAEIWEREGGLDTRFRVYGDVRDITPETVSLLQLLNVDTVLMGIESGDRNVLLANGKDFTCGTVLRACELLAEADIRIADAYVLGLAGENWTSIDKTLKLAQSVHSICETSATYWNVMLPLPGSPSWEMLSRVSPRTTDMTENYQFDVEAVRRDFLAQCTELGPHALGKLEELRADLCRESSMLVGEYIR